jgi:hypothetical protein
VANSTRLVIYRDTVGTGSAAVAAYWEDVHPSGMMRTHLMMVGRTPSLDSVATGEFLAVLATMKVAGRDAEWVGEITGPVVTGEQDTTQTDGRK